MRIISFTKFKQHCAHLESWVLEVDECTIGDSDYKHKIILNEKFGYFPCQEKYCPVLRDCKTRRHQ